VHQRAFGHVLLIGNVAYGCIKDNTFLELLEEIGRLDEIDGELLQKSLHGAPH